MKPALLHLGGLIGLALLGWAALAEGYKQLAWVKVEEKGGLVLSNGAKAPVGAKPGQFVALKNGGAKLLAQWRSPQDIEVAWASKGVGRVVFSHERHFSAIGVKQCETCHAEEKGLGKNTTWPSLVTGLEAEPHKPQSLGRFCATCHDGKTTAASLPEAKPPVPLKIFSAMGKGGASCDRCHAPASHGTDFTPIHGEFAEDGANCSSCHRGGAQISPRDLGQAMAYIKAQLKLVKDSEDTASFQKTLPNNFCAYCHAADRELWQEKN
ncbi:cytochrome c3 family protein [Meiothermus sp.]|uniref:cytochrome c3 family protein n=1 Tax=Meiothermus sp. TaxID=1955249 RepID=UPI0021DE230F|nr:cytochrome c3 family protein [Meiothermus sp.]GIW24351.1 MAG: hypothetical protein KatS3mg069_0618 [Meiothermus sp.]